MPPPTGEKVLAFGYRESKIEVTEKPDGGHHIELNDKPTASIGEVGQIVPERRDSSMLTFPCFEVCARFAAGMSGGMVIDENGALCGLVCAGYSVADPDALPLSYAATLWPMLSTVISIERGEAYPRGVECPMIDLALDKLINVVGLERLDPTFSPAWLKYPSNPHQRTEEFIVFLPNNFADFIGNAVYCHRSILTQGLVRLTLT
jgi:hypothetical protein